LGLEGALDFAYLLCRVGEGGGGEGGRRKEEGEKRGRRWTARALWGCG